MNGTLGRDKVWNDAIWGEIDKAVRDEMGRIRVAQKVFPSTVVNNLLPVPTNVFLAPRSSERAVLGAGDDSFQPFIEISIEFVLTHAQVDAEESMHLGSSLARLAGSAIAASEDAILFLGGSTIVRDSRPPVINTTGATVTNVNAIPRGFVGEAANNPAAPAAPILNLLADGIGRLNSRGQPGPYALFLSPIRYAETYSPPAGTLATAADSIVTLATGGFYAVNSLPDNTGILVSLGGEPAKIVLGSDATTAFVFVDGQGTYHFRVFERLQLMVRDGRAFQTLQ